jgi:hypothetical protein
MCHVCRRYVAYTMTLVLRKLCFFYNTDIGTNLVHLKLILICFLMLFSLLYQLMGFKECMVDTGDCKIYEQTISVQYAKCVHSLPYLRCYKLRIAAVPVFE